MKENLTYQKKKTKTKLIPAQPTILLYCLLVTLTIIASNLYAALPVSSTNRNTTSMPQEDNANKQKFKAVGEKTGGEEFLAKKYRKNKKKLKSSSLPAEDILMLKEVSTPPAPLNKGTSIRVSLENQRAWLYEDGVAILVSSVTPGKKSSPTPKGKFHIINKHRHWISTIYNVPMPYFLRLNPGYFGLHQGQMKVSPASHGCIRLPTKEASEFFSVAKVGDPVWID